ncbi:MAG: ATP-binding protein [Micromonosporaceae bacterium]
MLAATEPVLLVVDDLHWCDQQTLRFLHYVLRVSPDSRLMVAAAARLEELDHPPLHDLVTELRVRERLAEIELARLTPEETATLAGQPAPPRPAAESEQLYRETEGNPLFVIEAVRAGAQSRKVQAVIEARLARLSDSARELAGLAAAIGRECTTDVLAAAKQTGDLELVRDLDELWRRRIIREQGPDGYDFSHDKLREVAYRSVSPVRRRHHHLRIAEALRRRPEPESGQIATHYERAGATGEAVTWYADAARVAQLLHADAEAARLLDRGLDLLGAQPPSQARDERELALLTALLAPLSTLEGYASPRLSAVQQRAGELVRALGAEPSPPLLRSLALSGLVHADFDAAQRCGEQLVARGERDADEVLVVEGGYVLGIAAFWQADFATARRYFELAVARYRPEQRQIHLLRYGADPEVVCLSRMANALWFLGEPVAAITARDAALARADEIGHPLSLGVALVFAALLAIDMGERTALRRYADQLSAIEERGRPNDIVREALCGYVQVLDGHPRAGIRRIQQAVARTADGDSAPGLGPVLQRVLLAACQAADDARTGLATAERLLEMGGGAAVWRSEARRLRSAFAARAR